MRKKRLDVWIHPALRDYITEASQTTGKPMNMITDELLTHAIAARRGEIIESQALPLIRQIVQSEVGKALALAQEQLLSEIKALDRRSSDRLAALITQTFRSAALARRLAFTLLAKAYGQGYAQQVYDDAKERTGKELAARPGKNHDREE
ncbi:MAG TPA: hypothetical protein VFV38_08400 [Ktedonobacteraceae bacterium]|nr:hypothetical protein [Ktedonobacteraceae bacterium]